MDHAETVVPQDAFLDELERELVSEAKTDRELTSVNRGDAPPNAFNAFPTAVPANAFPTAVPPV